MQKDARFRVIAIGRRLAGDWSQTGWAVLDEKAQCYTLAPKTFAINDKASADQYCIQLNS